MKYPLLLKPLQIDCITLPNRIVMPPMCSSLADDSGLVNQDHLKHYEKSCGPGLMIVEGTAVLPEGKVTNRQLGIYNDRHIEGLARLAEVIHRSGAVAGIQISHAGATASVRAPRNKFQRNLGMLYRLAQQQLMTSLLDGIRQAFVEAAQRAVKAGFDVVEIHGAHGKLFSQFLSPLFNWRIDRYGGCLENRRRFLFEVYQAVEQKIHGRAVVTCRLGVVDSNKRGLPLAEGISTAFMLEKEGMKVLDVSYGCGKPGHAQSKENLYSAPMHLAQKVKSTVSVPIIGGGEIRHPEKAEQALHDGMADLIYVGRGILADPAWARKVIEGKPELIVPCKNCKRCFYLSNSTLCPAKRKT